MDTADEHLFCVLQSLGWHEIVDPLNGNLLIKIQNSSRFRTVEFHLRL